MGVFKKIGKLLLQGMLESTGTKCLNPYMGFILTAEDDDLIADEMFRASLAYKYGDYGLSQDSKKAITYCRKAAERGHAVAQLNMVMWTMNKPDDCSEEVMHWLLLAAEQGERQALYNLGISFHRGDIGNPDIHKSLNLIRKSAEHHYSPALARLALIYANGDGDIPADMRLARYFALKGILENDDDAHNIMMQLATEEERKEGHIDSESIIDSAINAGEPLAVIDKYLRLSHEDKGNINQAISELEKYSDRDCRLIDEILGILYLESKDYERALKHFTLAAEDGLDWSQFYLADMYYSGKGVEKDVSLALKWVEKSLNFGNNYARALFSRMIMSNDLQDFLPDKIMRGPSYMELSKSNMNQTQND